MTGRKKSVRLLWRKVNRPARSARVARAQVNINQIVTITSSNGLRSITVPARTVTPFLERPKIGQKPCIKMTVTFSRFFFLWQVFLFIFTLLFFFVSTLCRFFFIQQFFEIFLGWWVSAFHQYKRGTVKNRRNQWRAIIFGALLKFCAACCCNWYAIGWILNP